ncbi:hypothetical protein PHSC3_001050 [Chlamydiales bacterium STE3]|nr:hypothetical protein PHSC3_001050 [Chlamydiales bacterium STE3]
MSILSFYLVLAAFGTGSSVAPPAPALQGPAPPQQPVPTPQRTPLHATPKQVDMHLLGEKIKEKELESEAQGPLYAYPGVVRVKDGHWVGYDYLYNIGSNIPVEVTIVKPNDASVPATEVAIKNKIINAFQAANIDTTLNVHGGKPPAALFNMAVLVYPVNDGFIALLEGRLLEAVSVKRVTPAASEGVLQAITWEQKNLIVASGENFIPLMTQTVENITRSFVERYQFFDSLKKRRGNE